MRVLILPVLPPPFRLLVAPSPTPRSMSSPCRSRSSPRASTRPPPASPKPTRSAAARSARPRKRPAASARTREALRAGQALPSDDCSAATAELTLAWPPCAPPRRGSRRRGSPDRRSPAPWDCCCRSAAIRRAHGRRRRARRRTGPAGMLQRRAGEHHARPASGRPRRHGRRDLRAARVACSALISGLFSSVWVGP